MASVGVATVSYLGIGCRGSSVANLPAPPSCDVARDGEFCIGGTSHGDGAVDGGGGDASAGAATADAGADRG